LVDKKMSFIEHLEELRRRLIVSFLSVFTGAIICWFFAFRIFRILARPSGIKRFIYIGPLEPFMVKLKIALWAGLFLAMPIVLYEALAFITPALKKKEKRFIYPLVIGLAVLFISGVVFGYTFIMPVGTRWLLGQAGDVLQPYLTANMYVSFAGWFLMAFGLSFETPMVILLLVKLGVISPQALRRNWRVAYLIILVVAGIITPDWSPITMAIMAIPMMVLYELSVLLARIV